MKSIVMTGQKVKAFCPNCDKFGLATYAYGTFPFDNGVVADNVMRATCDGCGQIVALAAQSAPVLKQALEQPKTTTTMRLPRELLDFVSVQLDQAGARSNHYDLFIRALLLACRGREESVAARLASLQDPILQLPNTNTINLAFPARLHDILIRLEEFSGISNGSELIRRLMVLAEHPPLAKEVRQETERLALAL
ncbi:hypothetical protein IV102_10230 [bacterium]|nr:hypothetical protein [bacterium]